jgi:LacI family transcriptional regulator
MWVNPDASEEEPIVAVTLADVAARAGVSQPTASRVLNGSARKPGQSVVAAVRKAADELGYIANAQAQALARSTSGLLGLIVQDIADPYFSSIVAGVQQVAETHRRQVMLAVTMRSLERELIALQTFIAHRADAIVLAGSQWSDRTQPAVGVRLKADLARYIASGGHAAVVGAPLPSAHAVVPRNRHGAAALARALVAEGARDFVVLGGPPDVGTARDRVAGFTAALSEAGISPRAVIVSEFDRDGGYAAAKEAVPEVRRSAGASPCVFAVTDVMALGAMAAFREAGLGIPHDIQVAGFDDIPTLRDHTPALTTVRLPLEDMGRRAAELALDAHRPRPVTARVTGEVLLRGSTLSSAAVSPS